jgi:alcohol dehydrogenase class IV
MVKSFLFRIPDRLLFGPGAVAKVGEEAKRFGARAVMVITDPGVSASGILDPVLESLEAQGLKWEVFSRVVPEPSCECLMEAVSAAKNGNFDVYVGLGGGSSMDTTKMVSAFMRNQGSIQDFFGVEKVVHRGPPTIMIPTTAGTGSEVTRMAVFTDTDTNLKRVVSSQAILPNVALVDPELTRTMPPDVTANTGMDAFIHAVEAYVAVGANPLTDQMALEAVRIVTRNLPCAFAKGDDPEARYWMALGSLMAGIALNNAGVGAVHALAYPIGAEYHLPHGTALSVILPATMKAVSIACPSKFFQLAEAMGLTIRDLSIWEVGEAVAEGMRSLAKLVKLPTRLSEIGADRSRISEWAEAAYREQRLLTNTPRNLTKEEIAEIFENSF